MITIVKTGGPGDAQYHREFMLTDENDVSDLPNSQTAPPDTAAQGSIAYTQDLAHTYMLGTDDVWREV